MLAVREHLCLLQNIADNDVFQHFATEGGQRDRALVGRVIAFSFLEDRRNVGFLPVGWPGPGLEELVKTIISASASSSAHSLRNRDGIMSGSEAFRGFHFCRRFLTPSSVIVISLISGNGSPAGSGMAVFGSSCVKVNGIVC